MNQEAPKTTSVPAAGRKYLGVGKNTAYAAARSGQIPTIRIGRLLRVPITAMERLLERVGEGLDDRNGRDP